MNPSALKDLKREHPALQRIKISSFFLLLWVIFAFLDPDPDSESEYGSTDLIESGSEPDPKHWFIEENFKKYTKTSTYMQ
jgi:hypothetical protein